MSGKTERTGKFGKISVIIKNSFLQCNMDRIYIFFIKITAVTHT